MERDFALPQLCDIFNWLPPRFKRGGSRCLVVSTEKFCRIIFSEYFRYLEDLVDEPAYDSKTSGKHDSASPEQPSFVKPFSIHHKNKTGNYNSRKPVNGANFTQHLIPPLLSITVAIFGSKVKCLTCTDIISKGALGGAFTILRITWLSSAWSSFLNFSELEHLLVGYFLG